MAPVQTAKPKAHTSFTMSQPYTPNPNTNTASNATQISLPSKGPVRKLSTLANLQTEAGDPLYHYPTTKGNPSMVYFTSKFSNLRLGKKSLRARTSKISLLNPGFEKVKSKKDLQREADIEACVAKMTAVRLGTGARAELGVGEAEVAGTQSCERLCHTSVDALLKRKRDADVDVDIFERFKVLGLQEHVKKSRCV